MSLSQQEFESATQAIERAQRILIVPHANIDPDGLSSALACYMFLKSLGKEATVIVPETPPESLSFLPGFDAVKEDISEAQQFIMTVNLDEGMEVDKLRYTVEENKVNIIVSPKNGRIKSQHVTLSEGEPAYDLIVVVDSADLNLLGSVYTDHMDMFSQVPIINVDHHISNTGYGHIKMIDPTAASATEVLYHWFTSRHDLKDKMTKDIATLLLTGLITDTRSFQNPNTTPRSLDIAAELLEMGARQQEIIQNVYKTKPLSTLKIWGRALNQIQIDKNARIVWSAISKEDLAEMDANSKETSGILDDLISTVPDADVYVMFTELEEGGLKASMRSSPAIDVSALSAQIFGGGGHPRAAGFRITEFDNFQLTVLECVQKLKEGMVAQKNSSNESPKEPVQKSIPEVKQEHQTEERQVKPEEVDIPQKEVGKVIDVVEELKKDDVS